MPAELIERVRRLPYHGQIDVAVGDVVTETQTIGHLDYVPGNMLRVEAAGLLGIEPSQLPQHTRKQVGDQVETGDVLAASYLFDEWRSCVSPYTGYLGLVSRRLGNLYIRQPVAVGVSERTSIDVAAAFGVSPLYANTLVRVRVGGLVVPGQPVAATSGLHQQVITSPLYGMVERVQEGVVTIRPVQFRTELLAYLRGTVVQVVPGQSATIRAWAHLVPGQYGIGSEAGGPLLIAAARDQILGSPAVCPEWQGKVVVAGQTADLGLLLAADQAGCAGLVMAHLSFDVLATYVGGKVTPGLTGDEPVRMPVILTEGFTPQPMAERAWNQLAALAGRYASINGTTHIRAGVIRPEIVICAESGQPAPAAPAAAWIPQPGDRVVVTRNPARGQIGQIVSVPRERQPLCTGSLVSVAVVRLPDGDLTLPIANLRLAPEGEVGQG